MNISYRIAYVLAICVILISCKKSQDNPTQQQPAFSDTVANITDFKISGMDPQISIKPYTINIRFADSVLNGKNLTAIFKLSKGSTATINSFAQTSGVTKNNFETTLIYEIQNAAQFKRRWFIYATNNDYTVNWGLGNFIKKSLTNNHSYNWYFSQFGTGTFSNSNCGPSCAAMAMKWADAGSQTTPQNARDLYPQNTDEWGLHTIQDCLEHYKFKSHNVFLGEDAEHARDTLKAELDKGNIVVLLLFMGGIPPYIGTASDPRVGRYYPDTFNHFNIAYGYKEVDDEFYLQVADPWNTGAVNNDGSLKVVSRFYRYQDFYTASSYLSGNFALAVAQK